MWARQGEGDAFLGNGIDLSSRALRDSGPVAIVEYANGVVLTANTLTEATDLLYPMVQRFPDGNLLVVNARCRWRASGPDVNARVIAPDGTTIGHGCLGDGIEHVQIASDGTIWVGYFDEGVFGNFGWGRPGPEPLGSSGLVAWSSDFEKVWELDANEGLVADCYALNVDEDAVWICPYTDFPVVSVSHGKARVFAPPAEVGCVHGLVVDGAAIGLIGSYDDPSVLVTGVLQGDHWTISDRIKLALPDGRPLSRMKIHCRGSVAHLFDGADWYTLNLKDL